MTWRGSTGPLDRLYGCLPYGFPMSAAVIFGGLKFTELGVSVRAASLFAQFPPLAAPFIPFAWLNTVLSISVIDFISVRLVAWLCVFFLVVRNYRINHFIRFNAMQALLLDIVVALVGVLFRLMGLTIGGLQFTGLLAEVLASTAFIGIAAAFCFSVFQNIRGRYAEIPVISEAAYYQVRS